MIITWQGHSCFKIQDKIGPEGVTLVTDPFNKEIGLKVPNFEANIITVSHDHHEHNNISALRGQPFVINCAGEYDYQGVLVEGIDAYNKDEKNTRGRNTIYRMEIEDISLVHLGNLSGPLDSSQLEKLVGTDILLIPVGGEYTLDAKKAVEVISQIEPRIVIPMHYQTKDLKVKLDPIEKFVKELGIEPTYEDKLKISKRDLPVEEMELVILNI